jgi:acyl-lipid omega-6 desaturase (Delta-12 desaturase)
MSPSISDTPDAGRAAPPPPEAVAHLRPRDVAGGVATGCAAALTALGIWLAWHGGGWGWLAGQIVLALALLQWFVLMHEAGHGTLFRRRAWNRLAGHVAGFFALIPFHSWRRIHARHHVYTGWQDLDATTALLVPRPVSRMEKAIVNAAWKSWFPLFSVLYRIQNFWNLPRIRPYLRDKRDVARAAWNIWLLAAACIVVAIVFEPWALARTFGVALFLSLVAQDVILLSQHTHMPRHLSGGTRVQPFPVLEQEAFTRSLLLPDWLSRLLLRFDLHERHHMYVQVPGYDLHKIPYRARHEVDWRAWIPAAKRLSGMDFLFGTREKTGMNR